MVRTVPISKELIESLEGTLSFDPDGVDIDEVTKVQEDLNNANFPYSMYFVEGRYRPELHIPAIETLVGVEAIRGYLQEQGRL